MLQELTFKKGYSVVILFCEEIAWIAAALLLSGKLEADKTALYAGLVIARIIYIIGITNTLEFCEKDILLPMRIIKETLWVSLMALFIGLYLDNENVFISSIIGIGGNFLFAFGIMNVNARVDL